jgi:hypothetical protein
MMAAVFEIEKLESGLREAIHTASQQPVLFTEDGRPAYIIQNLENDDVLDELLEHNPDFLESIRRARQDKAKGRVITLAEARAKYAAQNDD